VKKITRYLNFLKSERLNSFPSVEGSLKSIAFCPGCNVKAILIDLYFNLNIVGGEVKESPGTILQASGEGLRIATSGGHLLVREVQVESRPRMGVAEFLRGNPLPGGVRLGE